MRITSAGPFPANLVRSHDQVLKFCPGIASGDSVGLVPEMIPAVREGDPRFPQTIFTLKSVINAR